MALMGFHLPQGIDGDNCVLSISLRCASAMAVRILRSFIFIEDGHGKTKIVEELRFCSFLFSLSIFKLGHWCERWQFYIDFDISA